MNCFTYRSSISSGSNVGNRFSFALFRLSCRLSLKKRELFTSDILRKIPLISLSRVMCADMRVGHTTDSGPLKLSAMLGRSLGGWVGN
jgi:hypothetical protein